MHELLNGAQLFLNRRTTVGAMTDACTLSRRGYFRDDWFYFDFTIDNGVAPQWANRGVIFHSDNQAAVHKSTKDPQRIMDKLRVLFWLSALNNFRIGGVFIAGSSNLIADALSRLHERTSLLLFHSILRSRFPLAYPHVC